MNYKQTMKELIKKWKKKGFNNFDGRVVPSFQPNKKWEVSLSSWDDKGYSFAIALFKTKKEANKVLKCFKRIKKSGKI